MGAKLARLMFFEGLFAAVRHTYSGRGGKIPGDRIFFKKNGGWMNASPNLLP
jgi:hypothetical protein